MAQKQSLPEQPNESIAKTIPKRKESFLDRLRTEFEYVSNTAGYIAKGELQLQLRPVTFGIGVGNLKLKYFNDNMFFVSPRVGLDASAGRFNIFSNAAVAFLTQMPEARDSVAKSFTLGTTIDVIMPRKGSGWGFRLGIDLEGSAEGRKLTSIGQGYFATGGGFSLTYDPITFYTIGRVFIAPDKPYKQFWTNIEPNYLETKAGAIYSISPDIAIGVEGRHSKFERGGQLSFSLGTFPLNPDIYFSFTDTTPLFGDVRELMAGISIPIGRSKKVARVRVEGSYGMERLERSDRQSHTKSGSVLFENGDNSTHLSRNLVDRLNSNRTFDEFARDYENASLEEKIEVAAQIASLAELFYDDELLDVSVFSTEKRMLEYLTPDRSYDQLRDYLQRGEEPSVGVCANINGWAAEFLRRTGVEAYAIGIASSGSGHLIAVARDEKKNTNYIIDYGTTYKAAGKGIWPVIEAYARSEGVLIQGIYLYGKNNELVGFYKGPEGKLSAVLTGTDKDLLRESFIPKRR